MPQPCLAILTAVTLLAPAPPPHDAPVQPEALRAVIHMLRTYTDRDFEHMDGLFTPDFRYSGTDPDDVEPCLSWLEREIADRHLSWSDVQKLRFAAGPFRLRPDVDRPDPQGMNQLVYAMHVSLTAVMKDGSTVATPPAGHLFHVRGARSDKPGAVDGFEWLISGWTEGPPEDSALALAPVENPARGQITIDMSLPGSGPIRLGAFDVAGRQVMSREMEGARGVHRMTLEPVRSMPSGIYWLRLERAGAKVQAKVVLIR